MEQASIINEPSLSSSDVKDITEALRKAPSVNSGVKNLLKREAKKGDALEKFAKSFKSASLSKREGAVEDFVNKNDKLDLSYFLLLTKYVYGTSLDTIAEEIIEKHAEVFNTTYQRKGAGAEQVVQVSDEEKFKEIVKDCYRIYETRLLERELPSSRYMHTVLSAWIFDPDVLVEVKRVAEG